MNNPYLILIIGEIIIISFIFLIKWIFHIMEKKKVNSIIEFMNQYKKDKEAKKKIKECIQIIKQNNKE